MENCRVIEQELAKYSEGIADKPRWLVFTKVDLLPENEADSKMQSIAEALGVDSWFAISAVAQKGTQELMQTIANAIDELDQAEEEERIRQEVHEYSLRKRRERRMRRLGDADDDDDHDVIVHYES